jgi:hypothetical protein
MMEDDVDNNTFPRILWNFQTQATTWSSIEKDFFSAVAITMTDFWGLFMRQDFNRVHERTFWVEYVVPIFKHFSAINKGIVFSW